MPRNIIWGIASLYNIGNFKKYIALENKDNRLNHFFFYISDSNFFIRSNFNAAKEIISYHHMKDMSTFRYEQNLISPKIDIINNQYSISFISDAFGISTLYWTQIDNSVIFSNSSYFLAKMLGKSPLGINGLFLHLILRGQANYTSYFEDIFQIPPQSILKIDKSGVNISKRIINTYSNITIKDLLLKDIPANVIADSGISFSGGIDSSIITSEFVSKCKNVTCYSLVNSNNTNLKTDLYFATLLANQMNFALKKVPFNVYDEVFYFDMPILDHDVYGQFCLAISMFLDGKDYMISGSGADELFGGYDQIFYYMHQLKNICYDNQLDYILQRYSYTDFNLLRNIDNDLFVDVYNKVKLYYSDVIKQGNNPVSQLHYWFIYHHLFWILKMRPNMIKSLFPFLKEEFLSYCLETDYDEIFPYLAYKQSDPTYHLNVKNVLKEQYKHLLPSEILNRQKLPFSVQEKEIDTWYEMQFQKNNPDFMIPVNILSEIMTGKYGSQTKLLFLSYILWRQRVL